jgi:hypothetical protein
VKFGIDDPAVVVAEAAAPAQHHLVAAAMAPNHQMGPSSCNSAYYPCRNHVMKRLPGSVEVRNSNGACVLQKTDSEGHGRRE